MDAAVIAAVGAVTATAVAGVAGLLAARANHELRNGLRHRLESLETRVGALEGRMDDLINTVLERWR